MGKRSFRRDVFIVRRLFAARRLPRKRCSNQQRHQPLGSGWHLRGCHSRAWHCSGNASF